MAPGLRDPVVPGGAEPIPLRSGECHRTSGWLGVSWSMLSALVLPGRTSGWSCSRTSAPAIMPAVDQSGVTCSLSHTGPPRWCTTRCPVSSGWSPSACTAMCGWCGTSVTTSRAVPRGSPRGLGWPTPTCTITHSVRSCVCSFAQVHSSSVVINHTGVGAWGRGHRGSSHATSAFVLAAHSPRVHRRGCPGGPQVSAMPPLAWGGDRLP